jgi:hypothetical protein
MHNRLAIHDAPSSPPDGFDTANRGPSRPALSGISWFPPRLILLFQSKINAAKLSKRKQTPKRLLRACSEKVDRLFQREHALLL